jgi:hypothetical protein
VVWCGRPVSPAGRHGVDLRELNCDSDCRPRRAGRPANIRVPSQEECSKAHDIGNWTVVTVASQQENAKALAVAKLTPEVLAALWARARRRASLSPEHVCTGLRVLSALLK